MVRLAKENPLWDTAGSWRADEARRDGRTVHRMGDPACCGHRSGARRCGPTWRQFLTDQAAGVLAVDFLHVDTVLLKRIYVLVLIEHGTRRMHIGGVTANPTGDWTVQQARNLAVTLDERFERIRFLIRDCGSNFTSSFDAVFQAAGTRILHTAVQAPRMNAICERLVGTLCRELLDRVLILGEGHLRAVLAEYQVHYNTARPHQGIALLRPRRPTLRWPHHRYRPRPRTDPPKPAVGGLINEYARAARHLEEPQVGGGSYFRAGREPTLVLRASRQRAGHPATGRAHPWPSGHLQPRRSACSVHRKSSR